MEQQSVGRLTNQRFAKCRWRRAEIANTHTYTRIRKKKQQYDQGTENDARTVGARAQHDLPCSKLRACFMSDVVFDG